MIKVFFITMVLLLFSNNSYSDSLSWNIGNDFLNTIYATKNVEIVYSDNRASFYKIKKNSLNSFENVDLYLKFDRETTNTFDNNYKYLYSAFTFRDKDAFMTNSALFFKENHRIDLEGNKNSLFQPGSIIDSFSISFWIYPLKLATDEVVFKIGAHYYNEISNSVENQSISTVLDEGILKLRFNNVLFSNDFKKTKNIELISYERIVPGQWSNVIISYNSVEGMAKMYINGVENAIVLTTEDGTCYTSPLSLFYNVRNRCVISIAPGFIGSIDEFIINRGRDVTILDNYVSDGGEIISEVTKLDDYSVTLKNVVFDHDLGLDYSDIKYYVKFSDTTFYRDSTNVIRDVQWIELSNDLIKNTKAQFFQWKAVLLPGRGGNASPVFRGLTLEYEKDFPPSTPLGVRVVSENGTIKLKWNHNTERDLKGYKIYYGTKSGHYFSSDSLQGESPLKISAINQFELTGVKKNLIYYIAITAYDDIAGTHESEFSEEVFIRAR